MEHSKPILPWRQWFYQRHKTINAYLILGPIYAWYFIFLGLPLLAGFAIAFFEWNALTPLPTWVGLRNFETFFNSRSYLSSLWKQAWIGGLCLLANTTLSFSVALLLNIPMRARGFFRSAWYVPAITAVPTTTAVLVVLLNPAFGGLNDLLKTLGMKPIPWNTSAFWMVFWVVTYFVWRNIGPTAILWLAGLQSIDLQLWEAAKVDGANKWQLLWYVTLPGLRPIMAFIIITGFIGVMQMFDVVLFISRGGPIGATDVLMYRVFRDGLQSFNMGMAGASSIILAFIISLFSILYFRLFVAGEERA